MTASEHQHDDAKAAAGPWPDRPGSKARWLRVGVLVAIGVAILTPVVAYGVFDVADAPYRHKARWEKARADMAELQKALMQHSREHQGKYPQSLAEVAPMFSGNLPRDPFTRAEFHYAPTAGGFVLSCLGKDGVPGGDGPPDADIVFTHQGESR